MKNAKFTTWYEKDGKTHRTYYNTEKDAQVALEVLANKIAAEKPNAEIDLDFDFNWALIDWADGSHQLIVIEDLEFKSTRYVG